MSTPTLLMYNLNNNNGSRIKMLCLRLKIKIKYVKTCEYQQPLGALAGLGPGNDSEYQGEGFGDEMLVMVNFTNAMVNTFLTDMRKQRLQPIDLKAVLTPTNARWDSIGLHDELKKEHEAMTSGTKTHSQE